MRTAPFDATAIAATSAASDNNKTHKIKTRKTSLVTVLYISSSSSSFFFAFNFTINPLILTACAHIACMYKWYMRECSVCNARSKTQTHSYMQTNTHLYLCLLDARNPHRKSIYRLYRAQFTHSLQPMSIHYWIIQLYPFL